MPRAVRKLSTSTYRPWLMTLYRPRGTQNKPHPPSDRRETGEEEGLAGGKVLVPYHA